MSSEERVRKSSGEEYVWTQEAPVDRPFEKELSAKVKRIAEIFSALAFHDEGECRHKLDSADQQKGYTPRADRVRPVSVARDFP